MVKKDLYFPCRIRIKLPILLHLLEGDLSIPISVGLVETLYDEDDDDNDSNDDDNVGAR